MRALKRNRVLTDIGELTNTAMTVKVKQAILFEMQARLSALADPGQTLEGKTSGSKSHIGGHVCFSAQDEVRELGSEERFVSMYECPLTIGGKVLANDHLPEWLHFVIHWEAKVSTKGDGFRWRLCLRPGSNSSVQQAGDTTGARARGGAGGTGRVTGMEDGLQTVYCVGNHLQAHAAGQVAQDDDDIISWIHQCVIPPPKPWLSPLSAPFVLLFLLAFWSWL